MSNPKFHLTMGRNPAKRTPADALKKQIDLLSNRTLAPLKSWSVRVTYSETQVPNGWSYVLNFEFEKLNGHKTDESVNRDKERILKRLADMGQKSYFNKYPYLIIDNIEEHSSKLVAKSNENKPEKHSQVKEEVIADVSEVGTYAKVALPEELNIPEILISGTDEEIENHECFKGVYGRSAHIRLAMSVLSAAFKTKMQRRHNILFYGEPACAKTSIVNGIKKVLGPTGYLELDSTATTKAGIEKLFLNGLATGVPPVVFIEEIEKTDESALRVWLSALDERREIRKVNYRTATVRKFDIVCIATANDKECFDRLFKGGSQKGKGALSSRFTKQIYVPRPDRNILKRILERDINQFGGKKSWIEKCLDLSDKLKINDPREVLSYLVGGDRLLDGSYQADVLKVVEEA